MGRTVQFGNLLGGESAVDRSWVFTFVLAWALDSVPGRLLPTLSPVMLTRIVERNI